MSSNQPKKLLFSLKGVDMDDDDALKAFAQQVWEQVMAEFGDDCRPPKPEKFSTRKEGQEQ